MKTIIINGKEYRIRAAVGDVRRILTKYSDMLKLDSKVNGLNSGDADRIINFSLEVVWNLMKPRFFIKPYVFFFIFKRRADILEIREAQKVVLPVLYGVEIDKAEDREQGNAVNRKG